MDELCGGVWKARVEVFNIILTRETGLLPTYIAQVFLQTHPMPVTQALTVDSPLTFLGYWSAMYLISPLITKPM